MNFGTVEFSLIEKEIDVLLQKAHFYLQTYRAIDALNQLQEALRMAENNIVQSRIKAVIQSDIGHAYFQLGKFDDAMAHFVCSYEIHTDGNDKAALAGIISGYYLQEGKRKEAFEYAQKSLETATIPELQSYPYHIMGAIALEDKDYLKAIELMNKAALLAENNHCIAELAMIIMDISVIYVKMDRLETALSEIYRAERYVKECRNYNLYLRCAIRRAKILYKMGKNEEAKQLVFELDEHRC